MKQLWTYVVLASSICGFISLSTALVDSAKAESAEIALQARGDKPQRPDRPDRNPPGRVSVFSGDYVGQMELKKSRAFNGFQCSPTPSFAFAGRVTERTVRGSLLVSVQFGNSPIVAKGSQGRGKSFTATGGFKSGTVRRNFELKASGVGASSGIFVLKETVKQGRKKACVFRHRAVMARG